MRTNTKNKILKLLEKRDQTVTEIARKLNFSNQIIHRHLKDLMVQNKIGKKGKMPKVFYFYKKQYESRILESKKYLEEKILPTFLQKQKNKKSEFWQLPKKNKNKTIDFKFLLIASALYSSKVEGNTLDLNSFLNKGIFSKKKQKDVTEIENLKQAYLFAKEHNLTEKHLLQTHKLLSKNLVSKGRQGQYRLEKIGVFSSSGLAYLGIEAELVKNEMNLLFEQTTELLSRRMNKTEAFFWSLWLHLMIALIHPFSDGNGRIARILEKWFLAEKLDKKYWYLQTEKYYWDNLQKYYDSLQLGVNYWEVDFKKANKFFKRK